MPQVPCLVVYWFTKFVVETTANSLYCATEDIPCKNVLLGLLSCCFVVYCLGVCCRRYLRETLKMANAEDVNRLTSCSLVLLGHIFLSLGNNQVG